MEIRRLLLLSVLALSSLKSHCQIVVQWTFENITTAVPSTPISAAGHDWRVASAIATIRGGNNNGSPDICAGVESWSTNFWPTTNYRSSNEYLQFKATVRSGYDLYVSGFRLRSNISSLSGARFFDVYYSTDNFVSDINFLGSKTNSTTSYCENYTFSLSAKVGQEESIAFRVYPYGQDIAAQAATLRVDNVLIDGLAILPVELLDWKATTSEKNIRLEWITATEHTNDHFLVERQSRNGQFDVIGKIIGKGNTLQQSKYEFIDLNPIKGINIYRLKQVDFDGSFSYSKAIVVDFLPERLFELYPTFVRNNLKVRTTVPAVGELYDLNGLSWYKLSLLPYEVQQISLEELPRGHYFFRISTNSEVFSERIVKF